MSFKIKLSERLPDFPLNVTFTLPNGESADIRFTVKSLKASEVQDLYAKSDEMTGAQFIASLATGWNLEDEFNEENQNILVDRYPAVAIALVTSYMEALAGHRVKN